MGEKEDVLRDEVLCDSRLFKGLGLILDLAVKNWGRNGQKIISDVFSKLLS